MKIIIFSLLLFCVLPLSVSAENYCGDNKQKYTPISSRYKNGLLFEVKKCGAKPNYLLGTMHSDDPKLIEMLDDAFAKLVYSQSASFEVKFDEDSIRTTINGMYLPPDSINTLQDMVGLETYNKFVGIMSRLQPDNPQTNYYRMRPWAAAVLIQEPANKTDGVALDIKLQKFAEGRGIPVYGLETAESQLAVFEDIPEPKQIEFFRDTVDNFEQVEKDNQKMYDTYLAQDLDKLLKLGERSFSMIPDREFAERLKLDLITKRNRNMAKAMSPRLDEGAAFIAIGALHLPGEEGVLKLLEDKGYFIEVVENHDNGMMQ